jgi:hypothetical protein
MAEDPNKPQRLRELEKAQAALNKQYAEAERHLRALQKLHASDDQDDDRAEEIKKLAKAQYELNEEMSKQEDILEKQAKAYEKQAEALAKLEARYDAVETATKKFQGALNGVAGGFEKITGLKIPMTMGGLANTFLDLATKINTSTTAMRKATGYASKLDADLNAARLTGNKFGQTFDETAKSLGAANSQITLFGSLSKTARVSMMKTVSTLEGVGVEAANSSRSMDILTRSMGFTTTGASKTMMEMDQLALSVGMVPNDLIKTFSELGPKLAKFGNRSTVEFRKLTRHARSLGLSVQQIFDIGEQFDTFEGAADIAGTLNAQLGLRLNSVELLNATEGERINILRKEFQMRGKSWKQMGRFEKKAVAEIMKVDVDAAARLFGKPAELAKYQAEQTKIAERTKLMTSVAKKFQGVMDNLLEKLNKPGGPIDRFITNWDKILEGFDPEDITKWGSGLMNILKTVGVIVVTSLVAGFVTTVFTVRKLIKEMGKLILAMGVASKIDIGGGISETLGGTGPRAQEVGGSAPKRSMKRPGKRTGGNKKFKLGKRSMGSSLSKVAKGGLGRKGLKMGLKKIPLLGAVLGLTDGLQAAMRGDYMGALLQVGAGLASTVPGVGTAVSLGLEGIDMARNMQSDFIMRGNKVTPFRKDDIIMGGTSLMDKGGRGTSSRDPRETRLLAEAIGKEVSKAVTGALKGSASKTVKLILNERELGSVVANIIDTKLSLTTA